MDFGIFLDSRNSVKVLLNANLVLNVNVIELDLTNYNGIQHSVYLCCIQLKHYSSVFIFLIHQRSRIFSHKDSFPIPNYLTSSNFKDTREGM